MRYLLGTAAVAAALLTPVAHSTPRGLSADDIVGLRRISDPVLSPDGRTVVFTVRETDLAANTGRNDLWRLDLTRPASQPVRLTAHEASDTVAQFTPDGSAVLFLSTRGGTAQVWRLALAGGEATPVTSLPVAVGTFRLSPRGDRLVFSAEVYADCPDLACTAQRASQRASDKATGKVYDRLFVRHWDTWKSGNLVSQLFSVALGADGLATGAPVSLSGSLDADVPSKPFGDREDYAISPDGGRVAFAARVKGTTEPWSTNFDVYEVAIDGGTPRNLTAANLAWDAKPAYSPDGSRLAYVAMARPGFEADRFKLVIRDLASGNTVATTEAWDRSLQHLAWSADGRSVIGTADHLGQHPLWSIDARTGAARALTTTGSVLGFAVGRDRVVFGLQHLSSPVDLHSVPLRGGTVTRLTEINRDLLADVRFGEYEQFTFAGAGGATVHGYVMKPWNYVAGQRYPLAFIVHGGPQSSFANNWTYRWNPQFYAGLGYAVVFIDFHGSTGYGQAFTDSISNDWGGKPLEDLKLGLAAAKARYPWIDADRACALGASYGGYMMNWIAGRWNDGFRCLVNHAGIFDERIMYYATEELWFPEFDHSGTYYERPDAYERFNPVNLVTDWKTPMLVLHGERDYRVPYAQGLATFTALQRRGIPSRLVMFPDENHWISKPANSLQWHREVERWLQQYLR